MTILLKICGFEKKKKMSASIVAKLLKIKLSLFFLFFVFFIFYFWGKEGKKGTRDEK